MPSQRELDLILKISTRGAKALDDIRAQIKSIAATPFTFGGAIDSVRQLAAEFQKLNQSAAENQAAKEGAKVAAESAKAAQQVAKATGEQQRASQQAARAETEHLRTQKESIAVEQQRIKVSLESARVETEKARAIDIAARTTERAAKEQARLQKEQQAANKGSDGGVFGSLGASATALAGGPIPAIAFAFNQVTQAVQTVAATVKPFFDSTIGAAEKLNAQLLSSQTNLASSTRIFRDGVEITGATEKIKASEESLRAALKQIEKDTQSLVGVTSQEVNELFQITLTNAADLNNQSQQFPGPIEAATSLTKGWAASLKVIGLPLNQARQEINSIVKGQIDNNSVLAKNLNLTNDQVNKYKAQGRLVDELNKRLEVFVAGNAIASRTIEGQSSNIKDIVEIIGREFGAPLVEPIVSGLSKVFELLNANSAAIISFGTSIGQTLANSLGQVGTLAQGVIPAIAQTAQSVFSTLSTSINGFVQGVLPGLIQAFQTIAPAIGGTFQVVGSVLKNVFGAITTLLPPIGQLIGATFGAIAQIVAPGVQAFLALSQAFSGILDASTQLSTSPGIQFLLEGLSAGLSGVIGVIGTVGAAITSVLGGAVEFLAPIVGNIIQGLISIADTVGRAIQFFEPLLRLVGALGAGLTALVQGQAIAYFQQLGSIVQAAIGIVGKLASVIGSALKPAFDLVGGAIGQVGKAIGDTIGTIGKFQTEIVSKVVGTIEGLVNNPAFQVIAKTLGFDTAAIQAGLNALKKGVSDVGEKTVETGNKGKEAGEKIGEGAKKSTSDLQFQARSLEELGTSYEQLKKQAANAQRQIDAEGSGDPERFKKSAEELIKLTQQQLELGQISEGEATKRLSAIANNSKLEVGIQQNAQTAIAKAKKTALDLEKQAFHQQQSEIQELLNKGTISEAEAAKRTSVVRAEELTKQLGATEKAIAAEQAAIAKGTGSRSKLKELQTQEQQQQADLSKVRKEQRDRQNQEELQAFDNQQKVLESKVKAGLIGEQAAADQSLAITRKRAAAELEDLQRQRAKLDPSDKVGLAAIAVREEAIKGIIEDGVRKRAAVVLQGFENEQKALEGKRIQGLLSEEAFANQSLEVTKRRLSAEQKELDRQRSLLKPGDTAGQQAIIAKEAELSTKRVQAEEQFQARRLAIVERAQKKAEDAVRLSEIQRNTITDQLLARREIRQVEADLRSVQGRKKTIQSDIELERARAATLEKLPKLSDPVKEEERQQKIRASRIKSAELTNSLVRNEIEQQQAVFRAVSERLDRQSQAAKNAADGQVAPLNAQLQLQDALGKSLDNQNKLLESRKSLQSALTGFVEGELGILAKSAKTDEEKQKIAQLTAATRFKALQQQQEIEQQSLEIQLKQNQAALEREQIQNRIAKLQNAADVAQASADLSKTRAKPDATPEEIEAARLNLEAKQLAAKGLDLQGELLQQQGQVNAVSAQNQRQVLGLKQQGERDQGKQALVDALPESAKSQAQSNLSREVLQRLGLNTTIGSINTDQITNATLRQRGVGNFGLPGGLNPIAPASPPLIETPRLQALKGDFAKLAAQSAPTAIAPAANGQDNAQMQAVLQKLNAAIASSQLRPVQATVNNNVQGVDAAQVVTLATRRMTDDLVKVLGRS